MWSNHSSDSFSSFTPHIHKTVTV